MSTLASLLQIYNWECEKHQASVGGLTTGLWGSSFRGSQFVRPDSYRPGLQYLKGSVLASGQGAQAS